MALKIYTEPTEEPINLEDAKAHLRVDTEDDDGMILALITVARQYAESVTGRALITQTWKYYLDDWPADKDYIELPLPPLQSVTTIKYTDYELTQTTMGSAIVQAAGSISVTGTPVADEHLTVGAQVFHFKALRLIAGQITIDADNTIQAHNIVAALTADLSTVTSTHTLGIVTVTAVAIGSLGNSIVLTTNATGIAVSGSGTLSGGTDSNYVTDTNCEPGRAVLAYGETWPTVTLHVTSPIEITYVCGYGTPEDVKESIKQAMKIDLADMYENRESIIIGQPVAHLDIIDRIYQPYRIWSF